MALVAGLLVENQQKEVKFHGKSLGECLVHTRKLLFSSKTELDHGLLEVIG